MSPRFQRQTRRHEAMQQEALGTLCFRTKRKNKSLITPIVSALLRDGLSIPVSIIIVVSRGCVSVVAVPVFSDSSPPWPGFLQHWPYGSWPYSPPSSPLRIRLSRLAWYRFSVRSSTNCHNVPYVEPHHLLPRLPAASSVSILGTNSQPVRMLPGEGRIEVLCRG